RRGGSDAVPDGTVQRAVRARGRQTTAWRARLASRVRRRDRAVARRAARHRRLGPPRLPVQSAALDPADDRRCPAGGAAVVRRRVAGGAAPAAAGAVAYVLACGPFAEEIPTVAVVEPASIASYAKGDLGVVRPRLARRYLVQAYRVLSGKPPLALSALRPDLDGGAPSRPEAKPSNVSWAELSAGITGGAPIPPEQMKKVPGSSFHEF